LLRPTMVYLIGQSPDPIAIRDVIPPLDDATHIFLPVNDNPNVEVAEGGSHWSLLVIAPREGVACHYDSLMCSNEPVALGVTKKMSLLLGKPLRFISMDMQQQENGSDCGVLVTLATRNLLSRLLSAQPGEPVDMNLAGVHMDAHRGREAMKSLIAGLIAKRGRKIGDAKDIEISPERSSAHSSESGASGKI